MERLKLRQVICNDYYRYDIIKKVSTRYEMPDGTKLFGKQILNDPEKHFTEELLNRIDEVADKEFSYGKGDDAESSTDEPATEEVEG